MADKYGTFAELARNEAEGEHYRIRLRECAGAVAVIAPHGDSIDARQGNCRPMMGELRRAHLMGLYLSLDRLTRSAALARL